MKVTDLIDTPETTVAPQTSSKATVKPINEFFPLLDGIRCFAVIMVLIAHWIQWDFEDEYLRAFPFSHGVTLFFVLSGFLITNILLKERFKKPETQGSRILTQFYIRRAIRIFPVFFLLVGFLYFIDYDRIKTLGPWLATYTINFYQAFVDHEIGNFAHFWSLAVEEQYYLFWPLLVLFLPASRLRFLFPAILILSVGTRLVLFNTVHEWTITSYFTVCCLDGLIVGSWLAWIMRFRPFLFSKLSGNVLYPLILLATYTSLYFFVFKDSAIIKAVLDPLFFSIVGVSFVITASRDNKYLKPILGNPTISYLGKISYGIYLYHLFMSAVFIEWGSVVGISASNNYVYFVLYFILNFLIAHFSWVLIEKPVNNLKKRFQYSVT